MADNERANDTNIAAVVSLYNSMDSKLDQVIEGQAGIDNRLSAVEERTKSLDRAVRGNNGDKGLVTQVALIQAAVDRMESDLYDINNGNGNSKKKSKKDKEEDEEGNGVSVTWSWVRDKLSAPIIIAVILWLLTVILPQVLVHIGDG